MTEEQIKQKADDFIITRLNHVKYFSGEAVKILLRNFAEEIVAEATKELQSENEELQQKYLSESYEKAKLVEQIEKMKCCANCCNWYKGMRDENGYPCDQNNAEHKCSMWELEE